VISRARLVTTLLYLAAALLAALHLELLIERIGSRQLLDPLVILKWLAASALIAGLVLVRRRGRSPWRGRTALVFWLIVVLLHVGAAPMSTPAQVRDVELLAFAISTCLLGAAVLFFRGSPPVRWGRVENPRARRWSSAGALCGLVPRPPPNC
jgi:hypothetical protein